MATTEARSSVRRSSRKKRMVTSNQEEECDAGFRFTRQSKRLRKLNEVKEVTPIRSVKRSTGTSKEKLEQKSQRGKKREKRRSSFVRGRKLCLPLELGESERLAAIKGLHRNIPPELSPNERLLLLFEKSLQLMSERIKDTEDEEDPDFAEEAEEIVAALKATIKASLSKTEVCQQDKEKIIIPNPKTEQLEAYAQKSEDISKRMIQEDKEWEELLHKYEDESVSFDRQPLNKNNYNELSLDDLSSEQKELFSGALSLNEIMDRTNNMKLKSFLMIDKVSKFTKTVKAFSDVSESYLNESLKALGKASFDGVTETPHKLIKGTLGDKDKIASKT